MAAWSRRAIVGRNVRVCVVDSGIDPAHPELSRAYLEGRDFIDDDDAPWDETDGQPGTGHGTHVAAILAAQLGEAGVAGRGVPQNGVMGVAPGVDLLVARVLGTDGQGKTSDTVEALDWCRQRGARVVSLSLGSDTPNDTEREAFRRAVDSGMLLIAAAGNAGNDQPLIFPAAYPGVLSVGAVDSSHALAAFSNTGDAQGLVAPGVGILSAGLVGSVPESTLQVQGETAASRALTGSGRGRVEGRVLDCGLAKDLTSCGTEATCDGFVALVQRGGGETFADKVRRVRGQGAKAVIVANDRDGEVGAFDLGAGPWPPTLSVTRLTGATLGLGAPDRPPGLGGGRGDGLRADERDLHGRAPRHRRGGPRPGALAGGERRGGPRGAGGVRLGSRCRGA